LQLQQRGQKQWYQPFVKDSPTCIDIVISGNNPESNSGPAIHHNPSILQNFLCGKPCLHREIGSAFRAWTANTLRGKTELVLKQKAQNVQYFASAK
jgi:hypothetical protein